MLKVQVLPRLVQYMYPYCHPLLPYCVIDSVGQESRWQCNCHQRPPYPDLCFVSSWDCWVGGPMSDSGPESHELHPLLQGGIHGPEMISAAEKLAEGDKKQSDDVDGKDTGDSGSEEGQIANGEVENNYSYDYSQYYQPQDWSYLHTYYPPPNDQSEAAQPCNTLYVKVAFSTKSSDLLVTWCSHVLSLVIIRTL